MDAHRGSALQVVAERVPGCRGLTGRSRSAAVSSMEAGAAALLMDSRRSIAAVDQRPSGVRSRSSTDAFPRRELTIAREEIGRRGRGRRQPRARREPVRRRGDALVSRRTPPARRRRPRSPVGQAQIMIDGAPQPFVTLGSPPALWVAVRRHHDLTITIVGREIDPQLLVIEPVADPTLTSSVPSPSSRRPDAAANTTQTQGLPLRRRDSRLRNAPAPGSTDKRRSSAWPMGSWGCFRSAGRAELA
jgi:hypothetical protein